mmetsp:Transcript_7573/g.18669  ORF Transcript_7573/g.18669 Transcript_7573/m.18669 type:complete len:144 (-) Transcript_7573:65-496(-)
MVKTLRLFDRAISEEGYEFWNEIAVHFGRTIKLLCLEGFHRPPLKENDKSTRAFEKLELVLVSEEFGKWSAEKTKEPSIRKAKLFAHGCHSRSENASILFVDPYELTSDIPGDEFIATGNELFIDDQEQFEGQAIEVTRIVTF